jgi:hypothetical protein
MKLAVVVAVLCVPITAAADRVSVGGTLGMWTPVGELGAEMTIEPAPAFEIGVGAGMAFSGPQLAVTPRLRVGNDETALTLGLGASVGHWKESPLFCWGDESECSDTNANVLWVNGEAAFERITSDGVTLRGFFGIGRMVGDQDCTGPECGNLDTVLPYLGLTIGHLL